MDDGHLGIRRGIKMAISIAGALDVVHSAGIVHRDVKPGNIMVTDSSKFVLIDCGIAKFSEDMMPGLTTEGRLLGTLEYVAPEYLKGEKLDGRSDIYSLNGVLYEVFTTVPPFVQKRREPVNEFLRRIRDEEPKPANELNCGLDPEICAVLGKGLAKDPKNRYQSFKEFINDIEKAEQRIYKN
jgi:serine/threonine-protein kinase